MLNQNIDVLKEEYEGSIIRAFSKEYGISEGISRMVFSMSPIKPALLNDDASQKQMSESIDITLARLKIIYDRIENSDSTSKVSISVPNSAYAYFRGEDRLSKEDIALMLYGRVKSGNLTFGDVCDILKWQEMDLIRFYGDLGLSYCDRVEEE